MTPRWSAVYSLAESERLGGFSAWSAPLADMTLTVFGYAREELWTWHLVDGGERVGQGDIDGQTIHAARAMAETAARGVLGALGRKPVSPLTGTTTTPGREPATTED